jgi:hypothetical protein
MKENEMEMQEQYDVLCEEHINIIEDPLCHYDGYPNARCAPESVQSNVRAFIENVEGTISKMETMMMAGAIPYTSDFIHDVTLLFQFKLHCVAWFANVDEEEPS